MSNAVLPTNKVDNFVSSFEVAEKNLIQIGSDDHLDVLLNLQNVIKDLTRLSIGVNEELDARFNHLDTDTSKNLVIKICQGLRIAKQFIVIMKSHPAIYVGVKTSLKELHEETKQIDEFVQDIIKYKLSDQTELTELLKEIK